MISKDRITVIAVGVVIFLQFKVENVATFFYGDWHHPVKKGDAADLVYYVQNLLLILILLTIPYRYFKGTDRYFIMFLQLLCIGKIIDQFYHPYTFEFAEVSWIFLVGYLVYNAYKRKRVL